MILFTIYYLFIVNFIWWEWEKKTKTKYNKTENETNEKNFFPVWLPSHPPVYEKEADYFPVSEDTENKSDLP